MERPANLWDVCSILRQPRHQAREDAAHLDVGLQLRAHCKKRLKCLQVEVVGKDLCGSVRQQRVGCVASEHSRGPGSRRPSDKAARCRPCSSQPAPGCAARQQCDTAPSPLRPAGSEPGHSEPSHVRSARRGSRRPAASRTSKFFPTRSRSSCRSFSRRSCDTAK